MASSCFCHSTLSSADHFVVSVPTEHSAVLMKQKSFYLFIFFQGNRVWIVEGVAGKEVPQKRAKPQSPNILGLVRKCISSGPSQGPSEETEAQIGQWSSEWLMQNQTPTSIFVPSPSAKYCTGTPYQKALPVIEDNVKYQW